MVTRVMLPATFVLGRSPDCDIRVNDPYASDRHAAVTVTHDWVATLADLGSTNGTFVERGTTQFRVHLPTLLQVSDIITIGQTRIPWRNNA